MGLTGTGIALGDKIALLVTASDAPDDAKNAIKSLWENIGAVIVDHIVQNSEIVVESGIGIIGESPSGQVTGSTKDEGKGKIT